MDRRDRIDEVDFEDAWLEHPLTHKRRRELERKRVSALGSLITAASSSSDADVRGALCRFRELDALVVDLGGARFSEGAK